MKSLIYKLLFCFFGVLWTTTIFSQNIEKLFDKDDKIFSGKPFDIHGSIGLNLRSYSANGTANRQAPFIWYLHGNTNISVYKINIPFSVLLSAQSQTFSHPFHKDALKNRLTRIGASPYYKWIKLHGGHRNMKFSPLTVAGHTYLGGGLELTPGNIRFGAFYGKLAKTEPRDLALNEPNVEVFKRTGYGAKIGYGTESNFLDLIVFKAQDDDNRESLFNTDTAVVFRNENLVLGLNGKATLFERVDFNLEIASSAFTKNSNEPAAGTGKFPHLPFLLKNRPSTINRWAIDGSVNYRFESFLIGLGYKRVEPEYRSLGAYFFNNDLENYTLNLGFGLLENKLRIQANGGLQRNNLFNEKATQLTRTIGALNVNYAANAFTVGLNYSNFSSDIDFVLNADLDSLNAVVVTQQAGLNASYTLTSKNENRHTFTAAMTASQVTDDVQDPNRSSASKMYNANLIYLFAPKDNIWKIRTRLNYNQNQLSQMLINRYGAGLGVTRRIIENKWSLGLDANYYNSKGENIDNQTLRLRLTSPLTFGKKHRINCSILYLNRFSSSNEASKFSEVTGILGYVFSF